MFLCLATKTNLTKSLNFNIITGKFIEIPRYLMHLGNILNIQIYKFMHVQIREQLEFGFNIKGI